MKFGSLNSQYTVTYHPSDTDYLFLYNQMLTSEISETDVFH